MKENSWARLLAYVTGLINQELLLKNEYLLKMKSLLTTPLDSRLCAWSWLRCMALHIEAVLEFRHTRDAKPLISPVNAHNGTRRQGFLAQVRTLPRPVRLELKYPAPEYNPNGERLPQLLVEKKAPKPILTAAGAGRPARRAGVVSC
jgi:hypothetical protein